MPNWIEGNLKVRGKYDDVKKYLCEGIQGYYFTKDFEGVPQSKDKFMSVEDTGDWIEVSFWGEPHITGTHRAFVEDCTVYLEPSDEDVVAVMPFRQAWSFKAGEFKKLSDEWNLDFRLQGWERGMEFGEDITIVRGEEPKCELLDYDDWYWDCPMPFMGG